VLRRERDHLRRQIAELDRELRLLVGVRHHVGVRRTRSTR
jgi:hypothetical protein